MVIKEYYLKYKIFYVPDADEKDYGQGLGIEHSVYTKEDLTYAETWTLACNVLNSIEYGFDSYDIYTVPIEKSEINIFENYFYPMILKDLDEKELLDSDNFLEDGMLVETIFIKENIRKIKEIDGTIFEGTIETDIGVYKAKFEFRMKNEYFNILEKLYILTEKNKIPWKPINNPYITKFISVYLVDIQKEYWSSERVLDITFELGNLDINYERNYILCWNIKEKNFETEELVKPTQEQLTYEYNVKTDISRKYLVNLDEGEIFSSYIVNNEELKFIVEEKIGDKVVLWEILEKVNVELEKYLEYRIFGNETNTEKKSVLYDISEISDILENLKDIENIKLMGVFSEPENKEIQEKINSNNFLKEEFEIKNKREKIYLELEYHVSYIADEIISYILSVLEMQSKEFEFLAMK